MTKISKQSNIESHLVDWGEVGVENTEEQLNFQYTKWTLNIADDNKSFTIKSTIDIPAHIGHTFKIPEGSFLRYKGETSFETDDEITPELVGQSASEHFERFPSLVDTDIRQRTNGVRSYQISTPTIEQLTDTAKAFIEN